MVDVLLAAGADLNAFDTNGNTILHLLVYHELPEMYDHVVRRWKEQRAIPLDKDLHPTKTQYVWAVGCGATVLGCTPLAQPSMVPHLQRPSCALWHACADLCGALLLVGS